MMKLKFSKFLVAATLLGNGMAAHADTLAGVMWGGPDQAKVVCYLLDLF